MCSCLTVLPAAIATCCRGRDMADGTVREIFHDRTDRHDWNFGGTTVATHFRHGDVSNRSEDLNSTRLLSPSRVSSASVTSGLASDLVIALSTSKTSAGD